MRSVCVSTANANNTRKASAMELLSNILYLGLFFVVVFLFVFLFVIYCTILQQDKKARR